MNTLLDNDDIFDALVEVYPYLVECAANASKGENFLLGGLEWGGFDEQSLGYIQGWLDAMSIRQRVSSLTIGQAIEYLKLHRSFKEALAYVEAENE